MHGLLERLDAWLGLHRSRFRTSLRPGATAAELVELRNALGQPVPESLRTLLAWHNGQGDDYVGFFEGHWLLMGTAAIAAANEILDADAIKNGWHRDWIPFLDDDGGDYLVLDPSSAGCPVRAFWLGQAEHAVIAPTLQAWLADFVDNLEKGNYHEDPERGVFLRSQVPRPPQMDE